VDDDDSLVFLRPEEADLEEVDAGAVGPMTGSIVTR
jgi:hypothetical protein